MTDADWRSPAAYEQAKRMSPQDLAWEFLRRNPDYRRDHDLVRASGEGEDGRALRWGLRFPGRP